jgi:Reverse transcriptase (RNA-dependent DNA polymerase)
VADQTQFGHKHSDQIVTIPGYVLHRRDRLGRKGGGVAVYVRTTIQSSTWNFPDDDRQFEILWVQIGSNTFIAALYHPPRPTYQPISLYDFIEANCYRLNEQFSQPYIIIAGDMNQLSDQEIVERLGLTQIVDQPTRGSNYLDRIYVSDMQYSSVRVVTSLVRTDHKAVIASTSHERRNNKVTIGKNFRRKSPAHNAQFIQHAALVDFNCYDADIDTQTAFDNFYNVAIGMLDIFYPECSITVSSRDPEYITPYLKSRLRRKNRLMRAGRVEEAGALAKQIGKEIIRHSKSILTRVNGRSNAKDMWTAVARLTGQRRQDTGVAVGQGPTAESLNQYYAGISTDRDYQTPLFKQTVSEDRIPSLYIEEWQIFRILDKLQPTAMGLDQLPTWYLRLGAPIFCKPLAYLFNKSLVTSTVPTQWKASWIQPVPKTPSPNTHADYRPISITPTLTRIMERTIVSTFMYPALTEPTKSLSFYDQFAFRPTGSTTAALITMLHKITHLLVLEPYVIVLALDFSKAFDRVRHATLTEKLAELSMPDHVYNWMVDFFNGHSHCVRFRNVTSSLHEITASIIQGSAIGPASYVVNTADLHAVTPGNEMVKYADDTYLIVPAHNADSRTAELVNIESWACVNNLPLNRSKTSEIIFTDNKMRRQYQLPPLMNGINRVSTIKVLGVTVTSSLSFSEHVSEVLKSCARTLYALRVLRSHGLCTNDIHTVYRLIVVAKITYASSAWSGFISAADSQHIDSFIRRSKKAALCDPTLPTFAELCLLADEQLFSKILTNPQHILTELLPPPSAASQNYSLRFRKHERELPTKLTNLTNKNFIIRLLYNNYDVCF